MGVVFLYFTATTISVSLFEFSTSLFMRVWFFACAKVISSVPTLSTTSLVTASLPSSLISSVFVPTLNLTSCCTLNAPFLVVGVWITTTAPLAGAAESVTVFVPVVILSIDTSALSTYALLYFTSDSAIAPAMMKSTAVPSPVNSLLSASYVSIVTFLPLVTSTMFFLCLLSYFFFSIKRISS